MSEEKKVKPEKVKKDRQSKVEKEKVKKVRTTQIGGQAVLEGVMMRGRSSMATAVRDGEGNIQIESKRLTPPDKKPLITKIPIIRGIINFIDSMVNGTKTLMRSAEVYGDEEGEPSKFEKWLSEKLHIDIMSVVTTISLMIGLGLAIVLFVVLPQLATNGLDRLFGIGGETTIWYNLIEGLIRIVIFISYILLTSLLKDIRRTYMYHGAEHKTITCYESGMELTTENARKCRRVHNRCGTTFLFFVMLISILVFSFVNAFLLTNGIWRMLLKIALLPLVAGLSYELLKGLSKTECWIFYPLKAPGLLLQRITTREPDDSMLEVAIAAFKRVLEMDADESIKEEKFVTAMRMDKLLEEVKNILKGGGIEDIADSEWIVSLACGILRSEVAENKTVVQPTSVKKAFDYAEKRANGIPLWQIVGDCDFYGYKIKVSEKVLTPRPETEELCEWVLENITEDDKILDLCTGSGAIAIALKKKSNAQVFASDISEDALEIAKQNAEENEAEITFLASDMFSSIDEKFSVIVSNPPYIPTSDIENLDREVKDHEPLIALDGGADGLDYYRIIARECKEHLFDGGLIYLEIGINQAEEVKNLLAENGFSDIEVKKDIEGVERMIKASK